MRIDINQFKRLNVFKKRALALAFKIKYVHSSSAITNYSNEKISKLTNVSLYRVNKYINWLINNNYALINNNTFVVKKLTDKNYLKITINENDSIDKIVEKIDFLILQQNISSQQHCINVKSYSQKSNHGSKKDYNRAKKHKKYMSEGFYEKTIMCARNFAKLTGYSIGKANSILKKWDSEGFIKRTPIKKKLKKVGNVPVNQSELKELIGNGKKSGYFFIFKGWLCIYLFTEVTIKFDLMIV